MLILQGTLRQAGEIELKDKPEPFVKLWVEHETPRQNGPADLKISELLIPKSEARSLPKAGDLVSVVVRAYVAGRDIAYAGVSVLAASIPAPAAKSA